MLEVLRSIARRDLKGSEECLERGVVCASEVSGQRVAVDERHSSVEKHSLKAFQAGWLFNVV